MILLYMLACLSTFVHCSHPHIDLEEEQLLYKVQKAWTGGMIATMKKNTHSNILHIGCGIGGITKDIKANCNNTAICGVDIHHPLIQYAKDNSTGISWSWANAGMLSFLQRPLGSQYSTIVSFLELQWYVKTLLQQILEGFHKRLHDEGRCYLILPGKQDTLEPSMLIQAVNYVIKYPTWNTMVDPDKIKPLEEYIAPMNKDEFGDLCTEAGFYVDSITLKKENYTFQSKQEFKKWLAAISPYKPIFGKCHDNFLDAVIDKYAELSPAPESGGIYYEDYMLNVILEKVKKE